MSGMTTPLPPVEPVTARSNEWMTEATCAVLSPDLADAYFHPDLTGKPAHEATWTLGRAICAQCPVRAECLAVAVNSGITTGMFGGLTPDERAEHGYLTEPEPVWKPRRCGTANSYTKGCRCGECLAAHREAKRAYEARRRANGGEPLGRSKAYLPQ